MTEQIVLKIEEIYTQEIIELLDDWKKYCKKTCKKHQEISNSLYFKHVIYGLPTIIIPLTMTFVSQIIQDPDVNKVTSGSFFLLSGILSSVYKFFDFQHKSNEHQIASNKYNLVVLNIESTMSRSENYRLPSDVMVATIRTEIKNLDSYSPNIDTNCLSNCMNK